MSYRSFDGRALDIEHLGQVAMIDATNADKDADRSEPAERVAQLHLFVVVFVVLFLGHRIHAAKVTQGVRKFAEAPA